MQQEAAATQRSLGQWTDDKAAEEFVADNLQELKDDTKTIDLPPGTNLGRMVNPDGSFITATRATLAPSKSGAKNDKPGVLINVNLMDEPKLAAAPNFLEIGQGWGVVYADPRHLPIS